MNTMNLSRRRFLGTVATAAAAASVLPACLMGGSARSARAGGNVFSVSGETVLLNDRPFKVVGLRLSNALVSDTSTQEVIDHLDVYRGYGLNTISVYFMGSRFGDVKGYRPDASLDPAHAARMGRIIEAADERGMVVLVGCLYWAVSRAKEDLGAWTQAEANLAVANTVRWLRDNDCRNVFVDPDNEGMAQNLAGWSDAGMIDAAHAVDSSIMVAYNARATPVPAAADLSIHLSERVAGKPWIETEGAAPGAGGYWGTYSKESFQKDRYYNYSRIGRYTEEMKAVQIQRSHDIIRNHSGYVMASTWLQCGPHEGIGGPFQVPGGRSEIADVDEDITSLHPDAGVLWWLEAIRDVYGEWVPPAAAKPKQ